MLKNSIIVIVAAIVIVFICFCCYQTYKSTKKEVKRTFIKREGFSHASDFYIYNYLLAAIRVNVLFPDGREETLETRIPGKSKRGFKIKTIEKYFNQEHKLRIYTLGKEDSFTIFGDYQFATPEDTCIKALHVGMVTSRWVGADADYNIGKPGLNAVQGLPWIKIWNTTDTTLSLNNNIDISPGGMMRYPGRDHLGVRLGTVFKDQRGVFPDYIYTIPATDVYYGVVSDLQQPLFGGFQLTQDFHHDEEEPQFLLENGWYYGEANGQIPYGFIPLEGPAVKPQDRWGQPPKSEFELKHPVGPPVELNTIKGTVIA